MSWPLVALKDCCTVVGGATPKREVEAYWDNQDIPWVTPKDISKIKSIYFDDAPEYISQKGFDSCAAHKLPKGSLLLTSRAPIGNVAITTRELCTNQGFKSLVPNENVDIKYLYFCMLYSASRLDNEGNGATFKEVSKKVVEAFKIPLPPLETQKQIAAVLEKADQLRKDCQQMELELNSLAQSVFIDMFGDPVTNPKGWELTNLPNHGSFKNGLNFSKDDSGVSLKYLGVGDFKSLSSIREIDNLGFVEVNSLPANDYLLKNGDLVFVRSNGNKALVGRCISIYPGDEPVTFSGFCIRYRVESYSMEPEWLNYMLRTASMKQAMLEGGQGANIQNINQKILSALEIPLPPIDKQRLFCKAIESYRESLFQLNEYSQELNDLFNSLMQKAFKGELNL
ncbi:restriction endonuclease subunit S [Vibrio owensii]|uniref:restriction endonuclease subunit S n=1 Tax=Vibrio owensii TaxID=696485 RepID=UPI003395C464